MAAAAVVFLKHHSSSATGVHPIASAISSVMDTGRKQGESCASPWWKACNDKLSCYHSGSNGWYCVPNGQKSVCCGYNWGNGGTDEASRIDCDKDLACDQRNAPRDGDNLYKLENGSDNASFAQKGSCNVKTEELANILIKFKHCGYTKCHYVSTALCRHDHHI